MWHLVEQRIRDAARKGGTKERGNVVRECNAMTEGGIVVRLESGRDAGPTNQPRGLEEADKLNKKKRVCGSSIFYEQRSRVGKMLF